jgi:hypothetical protein
MVTELPDRAQVSGLQLSLAYDRLANRGPRPANAVAEQRLGRKPDVLAAPASSEVTPPPTPPPSPPGTTCGPATLPFDPGEAAALLERLEAGLNEIEATYPGGRFPEVRARAVNLIRETCRSYVEDRGWWEARHCDPMASLREAVPFWVWEAWRLWGREPLTTS